MLEPWLQAAVSTACCCLVLVRLLGSHRGVIADACTIVSVFAARNSTLIYNLLSALVIWAFKNVFLACVGLALLYWLVLHPSANPTNPEGKEPRAGSPGSTSLRPLLFPSRTTHSRRFPQIHSFSYSYLLAGIPIGWSGAAGNLLSSGSVTGDGRRKAMKAWFHVEDPDYLQRGSHPDGLLGKLGVYLESQHVDPSRYPYSYLVTAPRFGGFSFNPVSFWYLYTREKRLEAMILEVNNTFDERRMYFLEMEPTGREDAGVKSFRQVWPKDFHVSPFNDRDGSYSVTSVDPFAPGLIGQGKVDVNIILKSSDGKPKIVARVFSLGSPVVPDATSALASLLFVMQWWWVGFMTNPRILREARRLWSKGLQVFYRPEVLTGSIGRQETDEETVIESEFARFLNTAADRQQLSVLYISAAGPFCGSRQKFGNDSTSSSLEINILTPAFYSELARSNNIIRVIKQLAFTGPEKERMLHVSDDNQCEEVLSWSEAPLPAAQGERHHGPILQLFRLLKCYRSASLVSPADSGFAGTTWIPSYCSQLDRFVLSDSSNLRDYLTASSRVILSDILALGYPGLLDLYGKILFFVGCYYGSRSLKVVMDQSGQWEAIWNGMCLIPAAFIILIRRVVRYRH